jgi:hypothetical protein
MESSGDFSWAALPKEGLYRVPLTARAASSLAEGCASAAALGLI